MQFDFQNPATSVMEGIIDFHHDIMFFVLIIVVFVAWILLGIVWQFGIQNCISDELNLAVNLEPAFLSRRNSLLLKGVTHGTTLEVIWTLIPVVVLIAIAVPSFALLYAIDEVVDPAVTIKVIGHQWYWSYEYGDLAADVPSFDSYMIPEADLNPGQLRLLEVDRRLWLPTNTHIRVLVTSADVLHSWAVPALGAKLDCVPGRLNQLSLFIKRPGVFYGQCSELCGVNHGFMPIAVQAVELPMFVDWIDFNTGLLSFDEISMLILHDDHEKV
jgi:cytochrome c oxidase subunit 2